jgi:hypothetical protein
MHSQFDPRVDEMGPNGGGGYAEPLSQSSVRETFRREQLKQLRLAEREVAQHGRTVPLRLPSSGGANHLRPSQSPNIHTPRQDEAASYGKDRDLITVLASFIDCMA